MNAVSKKHYEDNKEKYIERNRKKRAHTLAFVQSLKESPCVDCGETFNPCAMDFDHVDGSTKFADVSDMRYHSKENILKEIEKCDLVYANYHRVRTWNRSKAL